MNWIAWIVLGIIAGFIAEKVTNNEMGLLMNLVVGLLGAVIGGWLFHQFGASGVDEFSLWSLIVATVGAVILLLIVGAVRKKA